MTGANAHEAGRLRQDLRGGALAWDAVFDVSASDPAFTHMIDMVTAAPEDIFTANLGQTRSFFQSIQSGRVRPLCAPSLIPSYSVAIDVLTVLATHARLARTGIAEMREPGFWISSRRQEFDPRGFRREPVMPISHLRTVTGFSELQLKICLAPLQRDRVLQLVRNTEGVTGAVIAPGIFDDGHVRRFMRR
ncbi:hypothetical protein ACEUZ9_002839 [Paracoccus litorisediminis]|uniref:hypothetical protein n=1 Tax=Paracoccus litorisediminis TaxID=2006130 RepID=UPI00372F976B